MTASRSFSLISPSLVSCQSNPPRPAATATNTAIASEAEAGWRRAHLHPRSHAATGRAVIGRPSRNRSRSSARAAALEYRWPGFFARHFKQIVSRSRGKPAEGAQRSRLLVDNLTQGFEVVLAGERRATGQDLVQDRPQAVDVGRGPDLRSARFGLLGGHVRRRAAGDPRTGLIAFCLAKLGHAEVADPGHPRLDVTVFPGAAVDESPSHSGASSTTLAGFRSRWRIPRSVGMLHRACPVPRRPARPSGASCSSIVPQPLLQARPGNVRRDDVTQGPDRAGFEQGDHVGMIQPRRRLRLAQKRRQLSVPDDDPDPRQLERHPALQEWVFGQVNHAEAAATELALDRKISRISPHVKYSRPFWRIGSSPVSPVTMNTVAWNPCFAKTGNA